MGGVPCGSSVGIIAPVKLSGVERTTPKSGGRSNRAAIRYRQ